MTEKLNAKDVLKTVNSYIEELEHNKKMGYYPTYKIMDRVYKELSIFDWWVDTLSLSNLKKMKLFLERAIELGFCGYVCFKVGASGCANGMWAHVNESTDGYSPDGDCLFRSFTPDYVEWSAEINGEWAELGSYKATKNYIIEKRCK